MNKLEDEEGFVRATAYVVLTASLSFKSGSPWETYFNYNILLHVSYCECLLFKIFHRILFKIDGLISQEIEQRFQKETEDSVRENMIGFIIEAWRSFQIP